MRFKALYAQYTQAPQVMRRRLYLETIDKVLKNAGKVYVVEKGQTSPLPLLNLGAPGAPPPGPQPAR